MIIIGLTGGIGSGKTTIAKEFMKLGVPVYFADKEAKELMQNSDQIKKQLIKEFGYEVYSNNTLNKELLAAIVFNNKSKLQIINNIIHPKVRKHFKEWIVKQNSTYVIQENAIIFENKKEEEFDKIILVITPSSVKIERVMKRDLVNKEKVIERMNNQLEDKAKLVRSDYVIKNYNKHDIEKQVFNIHQKIKKLVW